MATSKKPTAAKKVEAPIDNRETFVSLQKSFADSGMPVEEKLKTLYQLQAADSEIDKIIQLRGELPAEVAALEEEIATLKERSAALAAVVDQLNRNIADAKLSISEHENVIEKYQRQLETIANSREYDSLNKEIENQELLRLTKKPSTTLASKLPPGSPRPTISRTASPSVRKTSRPRRKNWKTSLRKPPRKSRCSAPAARNAPPRLTPAP